ncbi:hypothetical protein NQ318_001080 [Aromia moschata]|uniref:Cytochrome P450 n=1 Tax=Aromia moschata TaxID=1265417 RepID=A0AAV8ZG31_9CUCU|nr:hypothetical protein NQ318_001080 [Aromia moschata]
MAPIALGNLRTTVKDLVLGGYRIPKDTEVMTMHIIPSLSDEFKDAEKFIPDRYLRSADDEYSYKNAHAFASLPFGFGPRSCIGKRLANLELEIALTKIMRNFKMSWPHEDMKFDATLIYGITDPLKIRVEPVKE